MLTVITAAILLVVCSLISYIFVNVFIQKAEKSSFRPVAKESSSLEDSK